MLRVVKCFTWTRRNFLEPAECDLHERDKVGEVDHAAHLLVERPYRRSGGVVGVHNVLLHDDVQEVVVLQEVVPKLLPRPVPLFRRRLGELVDVVAVHRAEAHPKLNRVHVVVWEKWINRRA